MELKWSKGPDGYYSNVFCPKYGSENNLSAQRRYWITGFSGRESNKWWLYECQSNWAGNKIISEFKYIKSAKEVAELFENG